MTGYEWRVAFRMTPASGTVTTIRFADALTELGGPVRVVIRYAPIIKSREDVNYSLRPARHGYRVEVDLDFMVREMTDAASITTVAGWLMDRTKTVELTLDDEATWRECVLRKFDGPKAVAGKTFAGAEYGLDVSCVDLIDAPPDIAAGAGTGAW